MIKLTNLLKEIKITTLGTKFTPSEVDGEQIYTIEYNGKTFEFSYQEYDNTYICLEPWDNTVAQLFKHLQSQRVNAIIGVAPEKTIIIKKDEFEKFIE